MWCDNSLISLVYSVCLVYLVVPDYNRIDQMSQTDHTRTSSVIGFTSRRPSDLRLHVVFHMRDDRTVRAFSPFD